MGLFKWRFPGPDYKQLRFSLQYSPKSKLCKSDSIAIVLSNLLMNLASSESLFHKMNPDFLASSLLKGQVTFEGRRGQMLLFIDIILDKISRALGLEVDSMQQGVTRHQSRWGCKMCVP